MKRAFCIVLALLMLSISACVPGQEKPSETNAPTAIATAYATAEPGAAENPYPTQDPARAAFDPDTDFNNLFGGCKWFSFTETEDAYYLHMHSFIRYFDKISGESGVLCPRPECEHDAIAGNRSCSAYGDCHGLAYYEGRLYWFCEYRYGRTWGIFSANTDGSEKRLVREIEITPELSGDCCAFFHRGWLYLVVINMDVVQGTPGTTLRVCRVPIEREGYEEILSIPCLTLPQATLRFIGDDVYIFGNYDGVDTGGKKLTDSEIAELAGSNTVKLFVMRWNESMSGPELLYLNEDYGFWANIKSFWVERDGNVYFGSQRLSDPERDYDKTSNPFVYSLIRVAPDGSSEEVFDMFDGVLQYGINAVSEGVVIGTEPVDRSTERNEAGIWVRRFNGETVFKGALPLEYRAGIADEYPHCFSLGSEYFGTEDWIVLGVEELFDDHPDGLRRYYCVKYDLTEDGPVETVIGEEESVYMRF